MSADRYEISTDRARLDRDLIFEFLNREAYWSRGIDRERVERAIDRSLCFGAYDGDAQVGFARVVTDAATFAYLGDVFVVPAHRGRGLGGLLLAAVLSHPDVRGLRRIILATADAHDLYRRHGFEPLADPGIYMAIDIPPAEAYGDG